MNFNYVRNECEKGEGPQLKGNHRTAVLISVAMANFYYNCRLRPQAIVISRSNNLKKRQPTRSSLARSSNETGAGWAGERKMIKLAGHSQITM